MLEIPEFTAQQITETQAITTKPTQMFFLIDGQAEILNPEEEFCK